MTAPDLRPALAGSLRLGDRLDGWLRLEADGTVTVFSGKVEIGQGIHAALAQIVADELDVAFERVVVAPVDTARSPDEGTTSASRSIEDSGGALRQVAAEARRALLERASARLGIAIEDLRIASGVVSGPGGACADYAELWTDDLLARPASGVVGPKRPDQRTLIGTSPPRRDLIAKVTGAPAYVQDLDLPGMLHGRVVRPPGYGARLRSVDEAAIVDAGGVFGVVRDGSFLAVLAEREEDAVRALRRARRVADWEAGPAFPGRVDPHDLLSQESVETVVRERTMARAPDGPVRTFSAEYARPHIAHGAVGPSCAVARLEDGAYTIWTHSQGIFRLRHEIARVLAVPEDRVRVLHLEGAGCYGHNGADDAALDAALLARAAPGRPVRVQWMRDDEFAWEPFGTAMVVRLSAELDGDGGILAWSHDLWGHGHGARPARGLPDEESSLLAAWHLARPFIPAGQSHLKQADLGGHRNAEPLYVFPNERIVGHYVDRSPLRVSSLRSLGAHANVFAIESFMDELAAVSGADPIEFRLRYLEDRRAREVIEAVATLAGWRPSEHGDGERGRGIGFARYKNKAAYAAVIVEVEIGDELRVRHAWAAIDAGMVVSRDGLLNQAEGGIVQATSWTLHEEVGTDESGITTRGWDGYRTLRFSETPEVEVMLVDRPDQAPLGAGEAMAGPTAAAIANAIHNAIGVRVREMPFTRERLIRASG